MGEWNESKKIIKFKSMEVESGMVIKETPT